MRHLLYLALLAGCLIATAPLEVLLSVGVYRQWRRLLAAVVPVAAVFTAWDAWAVASGAWSFAPADVIGFTTVAGLPLEEVLFFLVVPLCSILTLEAVRTVRPRWSVGDEPVPVR